MALGRLLQKTKANAARFFGHTLPSAARTGVRYLNSHVIPTAKRIHGISKAVTDEVASNPQISVKHKEKAKKVSSFADLGLSRLENVQGSVNRVSKQIGYD
jgi:hypothetical protein